MITNIKSKDPTLHSKLACGQTALPGEMTHFTVFYSNRYYTKEVHHRNRKVLPFPAAEPQREKELLTLFLNSPVMSSIFVSVADKLSNTNVSNS